MAISTRIAPMYGGQKLFAAAICLVFGLWGLYDLFVQIPHRQKAFEEYQSLKAAQVKIDEIKAKLPSGLQLSPDDQATIAKVNEAMKRLSPKGEELTAPATFDWVVQWIYISCLPFAPWFYWTYLKAKKQRYTLEDDGTLKFEGDPALGSGAWTQEQIADIDMERWMMKSIAQLVHSDGARLKLDAYLHKNLDLIIGAIASRLHPDAWTAEAKPVKDEAEPDSTPNDADSESAESIEQAPGT